MQRIAKRWLSRATRTSATATKATATKRTGTAWLSAAKEKQSTADYCKAVELRRGDLQRRGLSVQSAEMLRRGKETLSIAMGKQVLASRGSGIEKRRRDLRRQCIVTLGMAKAKHGPAWQCQGEAMQNAAAQRDSTEGPGQAPHRKCYEKAALHGNGCASLGIAMALHCID